MIFIIFHGSFSSPKNNWFPWLKNKLEKIGQRVYIPQMPVDDYEKITKMGEKKAKNKNQNLQNWLNFFEKKILPKIKNKDNVCFIGHSIAPVFILSAVLKFNIKLNTAFFISPFLYLLGNLWQYNLVNKTFFKKNLNFNKLKKLISKAYVYYSDNDPYVDIKLMENFAEKLESKKILIKGGGHLNAEAGYKKFPLLLKNIKKHLKNENK